MSSTEFSDLSRQHTESNAVMTILGKLMAIEEGRKAMEMALKSSDYTVAAIKLDEIQKLMDTEVHERYNCLVHIYPNCSFWCLKIIIYFPFISVTYIYLNILMFI